MDAVRPLRSAALFRRRGIASALVGAGAALVAQNLSNGYFLLFFAPFVVAYALYEIAMRKLWTDTRVWVALSATAIVVTVLTLPFLLPYLDLRRLGIGARSLNEVKTFSADVLSYWTSPGESRLWGSLIRAFPKAEGDLFLSVGALVLRWSGQRRPACRWRGRRHEPGR